MVAHGGSAPFDVLVIDGSPGPATVVAAGELDISTADHLQQALAVALDLAAGRGAPVVVDLEAVTFMDCTGVGVIAAANTEAAERGTAIVVRRPRPNVRRVLELTGVLQTVMVDISERGHSARV